MPNRPPFYLFQRIQYSRTKSHATIRQEDPNFVSPALAKAKKTPAAPKANGAEKRPRETDDADAHRDTKRGKADDGDEDEMEIEEDDDAPAKQPVVNGAIPGAGAFGLVTN